MDLSIVIPLYDEEENVPLLHEKLAAALDEIKLDSEVIYINDGSRDGTFDRLQEIALSDARVHAIDLRRNYGQTAAMSAGFDYATGEVIVAMDGDLQNDPADIAALVERLQEGFDVVSGWRVNRKDRLLSRTLPSRVANWIIGKVTGVDLHDYGCSLKAYRSEIIKDVKLYGEMHRFIPALASWAGARVTEMPVKHHPRFRGKTKYGLFRIVKVLLDLITVKFILSFSTRPLQIFGLGGLPMLMVGSAILALQVYRRLFWSSYSLADKPIVLAGVFLVILGVQFISMGLIAEIQVRTYHESQDKPIYSIRKVVSGRTQIQDGARRRSASFLRESLSGGGEVRGGSAEG